MDETAINRSRITQRLRASTAVGHFWKWRLGHGDHCPWCWLCVRLPVVQYVIPYSSDDESEGV